MPFPMGKGHLLSWGIRGHPLTRSWHFVYTKCVSCKSLAAFLSQKWNNVRKMERGNVLGMEQGSRMERGNVREMEQGSRMERGDVPKWNSVRKWNTGMYKNGDSRKEVDR